MAEVVEAPITLPLKGTGSTGTGKRTRRRKSTKEDKEKPVIRFHTSFRNTIYDVLRKRGWKETDRSSDWDFLWVDRDLTYEVFDKMHLQSTQRINHFRNDRELCRKDLLLKNLKRRKKLLTKTGAGREDPGAKYDFWPTSFVLPAEYALFVEEFKKQGGTWIMKPIGKSQGKGIFIFADLDDINKWRTDSRGRNERDDVEVYVVQRYIANPLLIAGKKFDMRIYALVTSFTPLVVWMYRSGFCRFTSTRYSASSNHLNNIYMHLTNVAIQKQSDSYDDCSGGKWDIRQLKLYLISKYSLSQVNVAFQRIQDIVLGAVEAVQPVMIHDKHCFELYGYDIIFDDNLKPWLLEVNASPSLTANTPDDYHLKCEMLSSVLNIVDMEGKRSSKETKIGGFDLVYDGCLLAYAGLGTQREPTNPGFDTIGKTQQRSNSRLPPNTESLLRPTVGIISAAAQSTLRRPRSTSTAIRQKRDVSPSTRHGKEPRTLQIDGESYSIPKYCYTCLLGAEVSVGPPPKLLLQTSAPSAATKLDSKLTVEPKKQRKPSEVTSPIR